MTLKTLLLWTSIFVQSTRETEHLDLKFHWDSGEKNTIDNVGAPLVKEAEEDLFTGQQFSHHPKYSVIHKTESKQGRFYVKMENPWNISFYLFGSEHPTADSYRIIVKTDFYPVVEKCDKFQRCAPKLFECDQQEVPYSNGNLSNKTVFIFWKHNTMEKVDIKIQFKNYTIGCRDPTNFQIKKLVIFSLQQRKGYIKELILETMLAEVNQAIAGTSEKFNLDENSFLSIPTLHCRSCKTSFELNCINNNKSFKLNAKLNGHDNFRVNNKVMILPDWKDVEIPEYTDYTYKPRNSSNCTLKIMTHVENTNLDGYRLYPFLGLATSVTTILTNRDNKLLNCTFFEKTNNTWKWRRNFDLKGSDEIVIKTPQHSNGITTFYLNCSNFDEILRIEGLNKSLMATGTTPEWLQFTLPSNTKPEEVCENCTLSFEKTDVDNGRCPLEKVWKIVKPNQKANNVGENDQSSSTPDYESITTEKQQEYDCPQNDPAQNDGKTDNDPSATDQEPMRCEKLMIGIIIIVNIVTITISSVIVIIWINKRSKQSSRDGRYMSLDPLNSGNSRDK